MVYMERESQLKTCIVVSGIVVCIWSLALDMMFCFQSVLLTLASASHSRDTLLQYKLLGL